MFGPLSGEAPTGAPPCQSWTVFYSESPEPGFNPLRRGNFLGSAAQQAKRFVGRGERGGRAIARLRRAAGEKQTLIHGGIALPVAKPTPRTAVRAPKARSKKKARARDHYDEDDDGMDGMSGVGV